METEATERAEVPDRVVYDVAGNPITVAGYKEPVRGTGGAQDRDSAGGFLWVRNTGEGDEVFSSFLSADRPAVSTISLSNDVGRMNSTLERLMAKVDGLVNVNAVPPPSPPAFSRPSVPVQPYTKAIRVSDPEPFDGSKKEEVQAFLDACNLRFMAEPLAYHDDKLKIVFAGSYLRDAAREWARPWLFGTAWTTWAQFEAGLLARFGVAVRRAATEREFADFRQGNLSISDYITKFNALANLIPELTDFCKRFLFRAHLNQAWRDAIVPIPNQETCSLYEFQTECAKYEEKVGHTQTQHRNTTSRNNNYTPRYTAPAVVPVAAPVQAPVAPSSGAVPMEVDAAKYRDVTCYNCFQKGHVIRECTNPALVPKPQWYVDRMKKQRDLRVAAAYSAHTAPTDEQFDKDSAANEGAGYRVWST
jgi:hypothetical protein